MQVWSIIRSAGRHLELRKETNMSCNTGETCLITGAAGFIGFHLAKRLLESGCRVIGVDNLNSYYDAGLKHARLQLLKPYPQFTFVRGDIAEKPAVESVFRELAPDVVVNFAAQAGVRYSLENPDSYIHSNLIGFFNIIDACVRHRVRHLVYASSSSVYGSNEKVPFEESDGTDHPVSLYAATKKSNELMAYAYSSMYGIPSTGLRFFTVYGPMGRPDMAYYQFTDRYFAGIPIKVYNGGNFQHDLYRDFTYIDDIVEGIALVLNAPSAAAVPHRVFNIGNNQPVRLMDFIVVLEGCLGRSLGRRVVFQKEYEPIKAGDVPATYASIDLLQKAVGFSPKTSIEDGLQKFTDWYVTYHTAKDELQG